jgi:glucosamine--fructose-6-phosphate aminotransferase (isomerizing)
LLEAESPNIARLARTLRDADLAYVLLAARGSSDNAATYGQYLFAAHNRLPVALATPSLFTLYQTPPRLRHALVIGLSQSGESSDIVAVIAEARRQNVPTLALTNYADSPLARAADQVIHLHAEEQTIAATKSYTAQMFALALLSAHLAADSARLAELARLPEAVAQTLTLESAVAEAAPRFRDMTAGIVLGRGYNYGTVFEIALKLKELAYVLAEPYSSADFLHGPIAMVENGFPVVVVAPRGVVYADMLDTASALKAKGANVIAISDDAAMLDLAATRWQLPQPVAEWLSPFISIIPGQLFALHLTCAKGYDPDHPRGLKKVTYTL